mgnify:CR=1 FL=1
MYLGKRISYWDWPIMLSCLVLTCCARCISRFYLGERSHAGVPHAFPGATEKSANIWRLPVATLLAIHLDLAIASLIQFALSQPMVARPSLFEYHWRAWSLRKTENSAHLQHLHLFATTMLTTGPAIIYQRTTFRSFELHSSRLVASVTC